MDVLKGDEQTYSKIFSLWSFEEVCKHILKIDLAGVKRLPELKIGMRLFDLYFLFRI